eukprot:PhF_6_TR42829/c0_g1_i1/m.64852
MSLSRTQATSSPATLSPLRPHRRPRTTTPSNSSQQLSTATSPYPSSPSSTNKSPVAQSSVWESQLKVTKHEATMLEMAHHELTIRLQLLYHKLHTADVLSKKISLSMDRKIYLHDRKIKALMSKQKRLKAMKKDMETQISKRELEK